MKILIAEDDPVIQHMHHAMMAQWGYDYDLVENGHDAVELARDNAGCYDLALMDVEMPEMNGIEATRLIRREVPYFPIAAFSSDNRYRQRCIEAGMDVFIDKPRLPDMLRQDIHLLAVKQYRLWSLPCGGCYVIKERPVDKKHAEELRELAKNNLRKVMFFDHPGSSVIVHENLLNKVSHDFNVKKQLMTTFVNRDTDKPTLCYLYRDSNYLMPQTFITEEEYDELIAAENSELGQYAKPAAPSVCPLQLLPLKSAIFSPIFTFTKAQTVQILYRAGEISLLTSPNLACSPAYSAIRHSIPRTVVNALGFPCFDESLVGLMPQVVSRQ